MISILIAFLIGIITFVAIFFYFKYNKYKVPESVIKINFIDYQENNYYSSISLSLKEIKTFKNWKIKEKSSTINVYGFENKELLKGEFILLNSDRKDEKNFKIKIYKNSENIVNIKVNNKSKVYYDSEIIFYTTNTKKDINLGDYEYSSHDSKNRKRLLLYNINEEKLTKIIKDNNNNKVLENKALNEIKNNSNKLLLLNIYMNDDKSNILIFIEEEKSLITPSKEEKKFFEKFYWIIYKNRYNKKILDEAAEEHKNMIIKNKMIFGQIINNLDDEQYLNIYFSFINQGINCIIDNNIISKNSPNDYYFILGYILLYGYFYKKKFFFNFVNNFFINMDRAYIKNYSYEDLMRIGVSYTIFCTNNKDLITIEFTDELKEDDPYKNGFKFFKNIIQDLNEDSDLLFIYLQINSGYGLELINNKRFYKLSMISVENIKSLIIQNIPKYFYIYSSNIDDYLGTDARTQVMIFNEKKIFDNTSISKINNNIMNITIGMFHESGHPKFHMNTEVGGDRSPILCIHKKFDFTQKCNLDDQKRGESGKFIDHFLYNSNNDEASIILMNSLRSNELMNKKLFIGNLDSLINTANKIINDPKIFKKNNNININKIGKNNLSNLSSKLEIKGNLDNEE